MQMYVSYDPLRVEKLEALIALQNRIGAAGAREEGREMESFTLNLNTGLHKVRVWLWVEFIAF